VHARSNTIMADPGSIDAGIRLVQDEVMPMLEGMDGCIGVSMLVDRTSGRCIVTTAWQDENAMRASEGQVRASRQRVTEMMGGGSPQVEEWEIAVLHRDHRSAPGACVRATWVRADPQQLDRTMDYWKSTILPAAEAMDGFCSASLLVHRDSGRSVSSVTFDSREAMDRSRDRGNQLREQGKRDMGVEIVEVAEFELALAHLRVPELV
jgi:heme-degrading monooxygenase HmoA